jgi:hypothetical protein
MDKQLIERAIRANFACKERMVCTDLEDSAKAAIAFLLHLCGTQNEDFDRLIKKPRYQNKMKLVQKYLSLYS